MQEIVVILLSLIVLKEYVPLMVKLYKRIR